MLQAVNLNLEFIRKQAMRALTFYTAAHVVALVVAGILLGEVRTGIFAMSAVLSVLTVGVYAMALSDALKRHVIAVTLMGQAMLLVALMKGHAWQIDMHMYFFAALGMLAALVDWRAIVWATMAIAVHHITLNFMIPALVFPGDDSLMRVVLHAAIVLIEAGVLVALCLVMTRAFDQSENAQKETRAALDQVQRAAAERDAMKIQAEKEKADALARLGEHFENKMQKLVDELVETAGDLRQSSQSMSQDAETTSADAVNMNDSATAASHNVENVASASTELTTAIADIAKQVATAADRAKHSTQEAQKANESVTRLNQLADAIVDVVKSIKEIADRTNLLALNATIEAARAGDAGRGFAIVATEVKNLANQTADNTEEIEQRISAIQDAVKETVNCVQTVIGSIAKIDEMTASVAASVEEQSVATAEIGRNADQASIVTHKVTQGLEKVRQRSGETSAAAKEVETIARHVSGITEKLKVEIAALVTNLRNNPSA